MTQLFSCEFCEIFKNNDFYRTPLVAIEVGASKYRNQPSVNINRDSIPKLHNF